MHTRTVRTLFALVLVAAIPALGPHDATASDATTLSDAKTRVARFLIKGFVSKNCPVLVKAALERVDGVQHVEASFETKTVSVRYDEGVTTPAKIQAIIKDRTGFSADRID